MTHTAIQSKKPVVPRVVGASVPLQVIPVQINGVRLSSAQVKMLQYVHSTGSTRGVGSGWKVSSTTYALIARGYITAGGYLTVAGNEAFAVCVNRLTRRTSRKSSKTGNVKRTGREALHG